MQGLNKSNENGAYIVHTPEGIQLAPVKRPGKDSWYIYYKRKQICLSKIPELSTETYPVYYNYVFGGGFQKGKNWYYDKLLSGQ